MVRQERAKEALGTAIRSLRMARGLTRRDLERETEISYPYLTEIEAGKKTPSAALLARIAEALEVAPSSLMAEAEKASMAPAPLADMSPAPQAAQRPVPSPAAAAPPMSPQSARRSFFHRGGPQDESPEVQDPLVELLRIARELDPDGLELLLELARRLNRPPV